MNRCTHLCKVINILDGWLCKSSTLAKAHSRNPNRLVTALQWNQPTPHKRLISTTPIRLSSDEFNAAKDRVTQLRNEPDNDVKLKLYALFKQSTTGPCDIPKPGMMDFVGRAKWQVWSDLKDLDKSGAESKYIDLVASLVAAEGGTTDATSAQQSTSSKFETLLTETINGIYKITLNRPKKYNAITQQMYAEWVEALEEAGKDKNVKAAVTTGAGDFYCSGNDLNNFAEALQGGQSIKDAAEKGGETLRKYVTAFIDFPKPLIAAINGPAVGVSVTVLGLYDGVYASDKATFHTPFTALGQSAEGCSSFTFPRMMGQAKATGMLLFNERISAQQACELGLVTRVIAHDKFEAFVQERLDDISKLPTESLCVSKTLIRDAIRADLHAVNKRECDVLVGRWQSKECMDALMAFAQRKAKS